jgi:hypothetical protein
VDVQGAREQFADHRAAGGRVDGLGLAGLKEQVVGPAAGPDVGAEKGPQVALEGARELAEGGQLAEAGQGQVDQ